MTGSRFTVFAWAALVVGGPIIALACVGGQNGYYVDATDIPTNGQPVNPYYVNCGGVPDGCDTDGGSAFCCAGPGVPNDGLCENAGTVCPARSGAITCNEAADCDVPQFCCATISGGVDAGYASTQCASACASPEIQFCRTNGECRNGQKCVIQKCSDGLTYEMCGVFSPAGGLFTCKAQ